MLHILIESVELSSLSGKSSLTAFLVSESCKKFKIENDFFTKTFGNLLLQYSKNMTLYKNLLFEQSTTKSRHRVILYLESKKLFVLYL